MFLIIGLGNPGKKYGKTRHNAGRVLLSRVANRAIYPPDDDCFEVNKKLDSELCKIEIGDSTALLARPILFMNQSGEAARKLADFYKVEPKDIIVLSDDTNLDLGAARIRFGGESGGHNGLKSIISSIGPEFWRVRVGVGQNEAFALEDYVLQKFSPLEQEVVDRVVDKVAEDLIMLISCAEMESKTINCGSSTISSAITTKE